MKSNRGAILTSFATWFSLSKDSALSWGFTNVHRRVKRQTISLHPSNFLRAGVRSDESDPSDLRNKFASAAAQERRREEKRRKERQQDVVIGKTSAKKGASDFVIDPKTTQQQYLAQVSNVEREVILQTEAGLEALRMLQLQEANEAFSKVYALKPNAYLFAAGIVKFYLNDVYSAGQIFARNAQLYETRFGSVASEERIWRDACYLKLYNSLPRRDRENNVSFYDIPKIPPFEGDVIDNNEDQFDNSIKLEKRKIQRLARDLFDASVLNDQPRIIISRAKLRAIAGDSSKKYGILDPKQWKLTSWIYLGLHYDVMGQLDQSKECMKNAVLLSSVAGASQDLFRHLPMIHMSQRDWFDDEEIDHVGDNSRTDLKYSVDDTKVLQADIQQEILNSIQKMTIADIKVYLERKGIMVNGKKTELQAKMFSRLITDALNLSNELER